MPCAQNFSSSAARKLYFCKVERSIYTNYIKTKLYITNQSCQHTRSTLWKGNHSSAQSVYSPPPSANKSASEGCKHNDTRTFDGAVIIQ